VSEGRARAVLAVIAAAMIAATALVKLPAFWGDAATYYAMARSLAEDGDLEYEARDLFRVRRDYPSGPQGIFLKRASGGFTFDGPGILARVPEDQPRIYFAKAFVHPALAAPFVWALGARGLLMTNGIALAAALALAYRELRRRAAPGAALAAACALLLATVAPLYLVWPTPEIVTLALVMAGLSAWRSERPILSAVLLGLATYTKPYNLFLALPLGVAPLLPRPSWRGLGESARRGVVLAATVIALFGLNKAVTGELNYQGGERKTFYGRFPFDMDGPTVVTFGNSGIWMTTNQPGPLVEGRDDDLVTRQTGPARPAGEIAASFRRNLYYFWIGRFGGALPYFFPAVLALATFLFRGPRGRDGWLATAALAVSWLFYIWMIPDNWYGGGGTLGNRYFLNLLPLAVVLVPPGRERRVAVAGTVFSAFFLWPLWAAPVRHSLRPGDHATVNPFRLFPPEITMLNDLAVFTELWRKKQSYGDTEGDPHKHWPADPKAYYLYFTDNGTYAREAYAGVDGFWLKGGQPSEVLIRALEPVRTVTARVTGGPAGDDVSVAMGGERKRLTVAPGETREASFAPGPGFPYYDTFVHLVRIRSHRGGPEPDPAVPERRTLGAFVSFALETDRRPPRP
jgi:glycosyl transferase family 87